MLGYAASTFVTSDCTFILRKTLDRAVIGNLIMFIVLEALRYLGSEYACMESHSASVGTVHVTEVLHNLISTYAFKSPVIAI